MHHWLVLCLVVKQVYNKSKHIVESELIRNIDRSIRRRFDGFVRYRSDCLQDWSSTSILRKMSSGCVRTTRKVQLSSKREFYCCKGRTNKSSETGDRSITKEGTECVNVIYCTMNCRWSLGLTYDLGLGSSGLVLSRVEA